ncbi:hypothetical protein GCM10007392_28680 [Saccharospirillum salsuginis]|uniref:Uncharacterized protein n=1 Tax=Saccharospirillum salsuginis TaxID=418750 RepID=A0A918NBZ0_9GAMM|nr:hypothetical protein GCM10007392_28680 [Saccharospirillum salsuginis]
MAVDAGSESTAISNPAVRPLRKRPFAGTAWYRECGSVGTEYVAAIGTMPYASVMNRFRTGPLQAILTSRDGNGHAEC